MLDLGSGAGKLRYLAHRVGREGRIIGVDMNAEMLGLARKYYGEMAVKLGGDRVRFVKGRDPGLGLGSRSRRGVSPPVRCTHCPTYRISKAGKENSGTKIR